jgi:ankyrin repeat protein
MKVESVMNRTLKMLLLLAFTFLIPVCANAQCEYTNEGRRLTKKEKAKAKADAPFIAAIGAHDLSTFKELLEKGANVNARDCESGSTALIESVIYNEWEMFKMLLEKKANVNAQNNSGLTALMYAAESVKVDMLKELLKVGAKVNIRDDFGFTALGRASRYSTEGDDRVVRMLKEHGASK